MKLEPLLTNGNPYLREFAKEYVEKFPSLEVDWRKSWDQVIGEVELLIRSIEIIHSSGKILYDLKHKKVLALCPRNEIFLKEWDAKIYWEPETTLENLLLHILPEKGEEWAVSKRVIFGKIKKSKEELREEIDTRLPHYPRHLPTNITLEPMGQGDGTGFCWGERLLLWPISDITYDTGEVNGDLLATIMDDHRDLWEGIERIPSATDPFKGPIREPKKQY